MTLAICYRSGAPKRGAPLARPLRCLATDTPQNVTTVLALTIDFFTTSDLVQVNRDYKVGKKPELSEVTQEADCPNNFHTSIDNGSHWVREAAKIAGIRHE